MNDQFSQKSLQVNLRFGKQEYDNLLLFAKSMYDMRKIPDPKVASLLRWLARSFQSRVAYEQQELIHQIRKNIEQQEFMEFLRRKYGDSQSHG